MEKVDDDLSLREGNSFSRGSEEGVPWRDHWPFLVAMAVGLAVVAPLASLVW